MPRLRSAFSLKSDGQLVIFREIRALLGIIEFLLQLFISLFELGVVCQMTPNAGDVRLQRAFMSLTQSLQEAEEPFREGKNADLLSF